MSQLGNAGMTLSASASPYIIGGGLNFGSVPGMNDYAGAYANALSLNQQNYGNILSGYQGLMGSQGAAQNNIQQGYGNLSGQVLNDIQGIGASQSQAIQDVYAQQSGQAAQGLTSRGLGNTTVANSVQRGLTLDQQKAQIALANQMAQLTAGYRSSLGLAGLNYANQANMQNTALGSQQLGFMNSVNAPYPNAQAYSQLAMQQGMIDQANRFSKLYGYGVGGGGRSAYPSVNMGSASGFGIGGVRSSGGGGGGGGMSMGAGGGAPQGVTRGGSSGDMIDTTGAYAGAAGPSGPMTPNPAVQDDTTTNDWLNYNDTPAVQQDYGTGAYGGADWGGGSSYSEDFSDF